MSTDSPPSRRLELTGAVNFRDIGGYRSADGRQVQWRRLFRSDSLAMLSDSDLAVVEALQLGSLFDLRHEHERSAHPNRLESRWARRSHGIGFYPLGTERLMLRVRQRAIAVDEAREALLVMYRGLPVQQASHYARLLASLVEPQALPAVIHCTSGKDRTGFAIAVVLMALGVPRETILEDYVLTNEYRRDLSFMLGTEVDPAVLDMVKRADPDFLLATFEVIDQTWGSSERFIREALGFTAEQQRCLQELLLE